MTQNNNSTITTQIVPFTQTIPFTIYSTIIILAFSLAQFTLAPRVFATSNLIISEALPNPEGSDSAEFIELVNLSSASIDISNYTLDDITTGGSHPYTIPAGTTIPSQSVLVFPKSDTGLVLNNTSDQVNLLDNTGALVQSISYDHPPEGKSYTYTSDGAYSYLDPTPGSFDSSLFPTSSTSQSSSSDPSNRNAKHRSNNTPKNISFSPDISINSLLPNPEGKDDGQEFIELKNTSQVSVDLTGWALVVNDKRHNLDGTTIPAKNLLKIFMPLKNSNTTITLLDPSASVRDDLQFQKAPSGKRYIKVAGTWIFEGDDQTTTSADITTHITSSSTHRSQTSVKHQTRKHRSSKSVDPELNTHYKFAGLIISEVFSNPIGRDDGKQWIELYNQSYHTINLYGCTIKGKNFTYRIPFRTSIGPRSYLLLDSDISIKPNSDKIHIYEPDGNTILSLTIPALAPGKSFALQGETEAHNTSTNYIITKIPTPLAKNIFPANTPPPHPSISTQITYRDTPTIFDFRDLVDPDHDQLKFTWDFDDDSPLVHHAKTTHTFSQIGTYHILITISDGQDITKHELELTVLDPELMSHIRISEVYLHTLADNKATRFIELHNTAHRALSLTGFNIKSKKSHHLTGQIPADAFYILPSDITAGILSDNPATLTLLANDQAVETLSLSDTPRGYSTTSIDGQTLHIFPPTRGAINRFIESKKPALSQSVLSRPSPSQPISASLDTDLAAPYNTSSSKTKYHNSLIGIAAHSLGDFGNKTLYLLGPNKKLIKTSGSFPYFRTGEVVQIDGLKNVNIYQVKVYASSLVTPLSNFEPIHPQVLNRALTTADLGKLITVHGTITKVSKTQLKVGTYIVRKHKNSKLDFSSFHTGSNITITGIVDRYAKHIIIYPRFTQDFQTSSPVQQQNISFTATDITATNDTVATLGASHDLKQASSQSIRTRGSYHKATSSPTPATSLSTDFNSRSISFISFLLLASSIPLFIVVVIKYFPSKT